MKKYFMICAFLLAATCLFYSCSSVPRQSGFSLGVEEGSSNYISIGEISVWNDRVNDTDLENQIHSLCSSMLMDSKHNDLSNANELFLSIDISQRSFYKNIDQYNSIFFSYSLSNKDGEIILQYDNCYETKESISSVIFQHKLIKSMTKKIAPYNKVIAYEKE